ncbi:S8 family peptidase [Knoellia sp. CPCC 206450]|uniref:S8 family peptidase n=1 Tax=Knoellia tibetensis TaxID=3404798 RepID=UPI003B437FC5
MTSRPLHLRRALAAAAVSTVAAVALVGVPTAHADPLDDGQWWRTAMGVDELNRTGAGQGVTVAVIDGPIDAGVPELRGRVASSTTECLTKTGGPQSAGAKGRAADHATSMASLVVGSGKGTAAGGRGIAGIAPRATVRHYAVLFADTTDGGRDGCRLDVSGLDQSGRATARAIRQAVKDGARVLSISLSVDYDSELVGALLDAYKAGAIVVGTTNNDTKNVFWPGIGNGVVTVTHVDAKGNLDSSALRKSPMLDFAAPGSKVASGGSGSSGWRSDVIADGASQATAITAGGLAAIWSAHPDATGNQVLQAARQAVGIRAKDGKYFTWFRRVGSNLPVPTGKTESYGFGIFAPADAVKLDVTSLPNTNPMVADKGVVEPTAEQIAQATAGTANASPSTSTTASPSASPSTSGAEAAPATSDDTGGDEEDTGEGSAFVWLAAAVVLAALVPLALLLRRRAGGAAPARGGDGHESGAHGIHDTHGIQDTHGTHDRTAATDGVAATTKEHSNGVDR